MYTTRLARGWGSKLHILTKGTHSSDFLAKKRCVTSGSFVPDLPPLQRLINSGISSTQKRPTVDRRKNLLWVVSTTYRRSHRRPTVGFILPPPGGTFSALGVDESFYIIREGYTPGASRYVKKTSLPYSPTGRSQRGVQGDAHQRDKCAGLAVLSI